ncbi:NAD(P)-dependent oxidoreductase [Candidatus Pacearchaeota archaeon]|nr:NAD(P)-dependent oxidoreductase [Candidatus Pacearchaeota archaeon]
MKKILITGAKGRIGQILTGGLGSSYLITSADLPGFDARRYEDVLTFSENKDAIIHLAWDTKTENYQHERIDPRNFIMFENVYKAALETNVPRVIMASSVHADDFRGSHEKLLTSDRIPSPTCPYGAHKVFMEALGKYYSTKELEVVCVRFGLTGYGFDVDTFGVDGRVLWFSNKDCSDLIKTILETKEIPNNFLVMYGVSNNETRVHSWENPFGWEPKDDASKE